MSLPPTQIPNDFGSRLLFDNPQGTKKAAFFNRRFFYSC
jgi:hypothetical protein